MRAIGTESRARPAAFAVTAVAGASAGATAFGTGRAARGLRLALWLGPALNLALFEWLSPAVYAAPLTTATLALGVLRAQRTGPR